MLADILSDVRFRLRAIIRRAEVERELDDELMYHLEREAERNTRHGLDVEAAARRARVAFGGVDRVKEEVRDARGVRPLETIVRDLRYGIRGLRAHPGFTLAVVATLALGIGANTAMFGVVDRLMFRPPAYLRDPGTVNRVNVAYTFRGEPYTVGSLEYKRYLDLTSGVRSLAQSAAFHSADIAIGIGESAREMRVAVVSASYFTFFNARPVLGRFFDSTDDVQPAGSPVVVLGSALWKTQFGSRRDVLGQQLQLGAINATIVGVAPEGFVGAELSEPAVAFLPVTAYANLTFPDYSKNYEWGWLNVIVRRKPNVTVAAATADLTHAYIRSWEFEREMNEGNAPVAVARPHVIMSPIQNLRGPDGGRDAPIVLWICGVAVIVLVIACANVANLLLGRAFRRRREIAVRLALGVTRSRLIAQLLTESLLLAALAGCAGLFIGEAGQVILRKLFLPKAAAVGVLDDPRTLLFACLAALLAGLLTGVAPALQSGRSDLTTSLKSGVREGGRQRSRTRSLLLLAQGALSVFLLVGAGLFVRSLHKVASIRLGYDVDPLLYVSANFRGQHLSLEADRLLKSRLATAASSIPGIEHVAQVLSVPLWQSRSESFSTPGIDSAERLGHFSMQMGSVDFFKTMGTRIVRGRGFDSTDRRASPLIVIVSEGMAEKLWPGQNALGKCIKFNSDTMPCSTVVGIAENIKATDVAGDERLQYYRSMQQGQYGDAAIFVRTNGDARLLAETVRKQLQPLMPGASYVTVTPMRDVVDPALSSWRMGATMFLLFGFLALALAAIGLYSVIAYNVAQRTQELGLRIALGAHARDVLRMILGEGLRFGLAGIIAGAIIALAAGHWVQPLLYGESASDPLVFVAVAAVLAIVAVAASAIPALRAIRVDPSIALRTE
ncbi:MAG TPA: ADOP family duplicated permease [Gemmatimonadaceae bacterium]